MLAGLSAFFLMGAGGLTSPAIAECATLASHPDDPDRIALGLEREEIDLAEAIAVCREAAAERPLDARTAYHLGRVLYYNDQQEEATPWLEASATAGYPQATFVLGYILLLGDAPKEDLCRAAELWRNAASLGHPWSAYHLVEKQLDGKLSGCPAEPAAGELPRLMRLARSQITVEASANRVEALSARLAHSVGTAESAQ